MGLMCYSQCFNGAKIGTERGTLRIGSLITFILQFKLKEGLLKCSLSNIEFQIILVSANGTTLF